MNNKVISDKLRGLRAEKKVSQDEIADKLHISRETFRKYESNPLQMNVGLFIEMLYIYDTNPLIFFKTIMANCHNGELDS